MGRQRGFQEIVSSVQGSFDFLQESEIEKHKQQKEGKLICTQFPSNMSGDNQLLELANKFCTEEMCAV